MLNNLPELLFLVARDFVQLTPFQQVNLGIRLGVCGVEVAMLPHEQIPEVIFKAAFDKGKMPDMVREMRQYLYE